MASASDPALTCPFITSAQFTAWNDAVITGTIQPGGTGLNTYNQWDTNVFWPGSSFPGDGVGGFLSIQNNNVRNLNGTTPLASFTLECVVPVGAGLEYFLTFSAVSQYANGTNDADNSYQIAEFLINDNVVWSGATQPVAGLNGLDARLAVVKTPFEVTTVPMTVPAGETTVKIAFRFTLPAKPTNAQRSANDDIVVSVPRFVCTNVNNPR